MSYGRKFSLRRRVAKAAWALVINTIFWIVIPYYLGIYLANRIPETPLAIPAFVYEFGVLFIILDVGAAFFDGTAVSVPLLSSVALLSAAYLWLVTNGGNLTFHASGTNISLGFRLLVYVFIVPSVWAAVRAPLTYLLYRREFAKQNPNRIQSSQLPPSSRQPNRTSRAKVSLNRRRETVCS